MASSSSSSLITMDVVRDCSPTRPKLTKHSERHPRLVLEQINQFRQSSPSSNSQQQNQEISSGVNDLCDVVLVVGESRIRAHKIILSASSPYFRAMFTNDLLAESKQSEIVIRDIDEQAMEMLVDFCYSSKITIDEKTVQTLLPASCLLQIHEVQDYCSEFLRSQLDPSNCLGIRAFADTHSCQELLRLADRYLQNNFVDIVESDEFLMLPVDQLLDIVSKDELNVRGEEQVYMSVMRWLRHDLDARRPHLSRLMTHVRFPLIDTRFLVTRVSQEALIRQDQATFDLVDEAKNYHLLLKETTQVKNPLHVRPRKPVITGEVLYAVGGWCSGDAISYVEIYDPAASNSSSPMSGGGGGGEWQVVASMSKRRCGVGVGVLNNQIYAIGGHDGSTYLNSTERYDPALNQWFNDVTPTSTCRTSVGVGVLDGNLYAVGGQDGVSCLNIVDKYEPTSNRWTRVAPMSTRRLGVAVVVYSGHLYAIGGSDGTSPLNSAERYDPKLNKWTLVAPMIVRRKHLACTVYQNLIYAVGGRDDLAELSSAERYDPQANKWELIVSMKSKRSGVGLAVVNGVMMAIGGFDGSSYLKTTEIYDAESNQWRPSSSMNYRRLGGGVGVVTLNRRDDASTNSTSSSSGGCSSSSPLMAPKPTQIDSVSSVNSITFQPQRPPLNIGIASSLSPTPVVGSNSIASSTNPASSWQFILTPLPSLLANVPQTSPPMSTTLAAAPSSIPNRGVMYPTPSGHHQETSLSPTLLSNTTDNTQQASQMTNNNMSGEQMGGLATSAAEGVELTTGNSSLQSDMPFNNSSSRSNSISSVLPATTAAASASNPTTRRTESSSLSFSPRLLDF